MCAIRESTWFVFCGTMTSGGLEVRSESGRLVIEREGDVRKFVEVVEQISFSGEMARRAEKAVLFVTERAVFRLTMEGLELIEVAPGIDLENDVLAVMGFRPFIGEVKPMPARIFGHE